MNSPLLQWSRDSLVLNTGNPAAVVAWEVVPRIPLPLRVPKALCTRAVPMEGCPESQVPARPLEGDGQPVTPLGLQLLVCPLKPPFSIKWGLFCLFFLHASKCQRSPRAAGGGGVSRLPCRPIPWPSQGLPHIGPLWASELVTTPSLTRSTWSHAIPPSRCHSRVGNLLPTVPGLWDSDYLAS